MPEATRSPRRRALVAAWTADRYRDQPSLHGDAAENARHVAELLRDPDCCAFDEVRMLQDPTASELRSQARTLIRNASAGDSTLLYYSGFCTVPGPSLEDPFWDLRLIVQEEHGWSQCEIRDLAEVTQQRLGRDLLLVVDATLEDGPGKERTDRPLVYRDTRAITLAASGGPPRPEGIGPLTQALAYGLRSGGADRNGDGYVSVDEIRAFLEGTLPSAGLRCWSGEGAADWILSAAQPIPRAGHRLASELANPSRRRAKLVLLAEDHNDNRAAYSTVLRHFGYETVEARDGQEAVEVAQARLPDVVLMDMAMPLLDGRGAARLLRQDEATAHIPIIALTAMVLTLDRAALFDEGFAGFLAKPSMPRSLLEELTRVIGPPGATT